MSTPAEHEPERNIYARCPACQHGAHRDCAGAGWTSETLKAVGVDGCTCECHE